MRFWKAKVHQLKGIPIDKDGLERRIELHKIKVPEELGVELAEEQLELAKEQLW